MRKLAAVFLIFMVTMVFFYQGDLTDFFYKQRHPGLINYDHGILSIEDLNKADKNSFPAKPFKGTETGYPYWQCFHKNYLKIECHYEEPLDKQGSSLAIDIETESEIHSYSLNHAISGEVCDDLVANINRVLKSENYFCINGIHGTLDRTGKKREYSWSFYRLKTKDGYAHYFFD